MIAAKLSGVEVVEFAIGLGPILAKKQFGETTYAIRALPIGGQCVMRGEDDAEGACNYNPRSLTNAKPWKKLVIICAGAFMNFLMGFIIFICLFMPGEAYVTPTIDSLMDQFTGGGEAGIWAGDTILEIDGYNIYVTSDITTALSRGKDAPYYDFTVRRDGERIKLEHIEVSPKVYVENGQEVRYYGFRFVTKELNLFENIKLSWFNSVNMVRLVLISLGDMFRGTVKVTDISGVVGITAVMSDAAKQSMPDFWYLAALIAINLSVMNLLPFPALDGGRAIFVLYEIIFRKPANQKFESYVNIVGILLLLGLMIFVVCNDIIRLILH